jgi:hypothetical protein
VSFDLRSIARALGGEVAGRQVLAPGPGHSPRDRSLAICISNDAPDGFLVHSHSGDDWRACRDFVRSRLGLPAWDPGDEEQRTVRPAYLDKWDFGVVDAEAEDRTRTEDDLARIDRSQGIWGEAGSARRTAGEWYLAARALNLSDDLDGEVLRFHRLAHGETRTPAAPSAFPVSSRPFDQWTTTRSPRFIASGSTNRSDGPRPTGACLVSSTAPPSSSVRWASNSRSAKASNRLGRDAARLGPRLGARLGGQHFVLSAAR